METKLRGFFGSNRNGEAVPFQSSENSPQFVVELADDGVFFPDANGHRPQSKDKGDARTFEEFINRKSWIAFPDGNPWRKVRFYLEKWIPGGECAYVLCNVKTNPHWESRFIFETEQAARREKEKFEEDGSRWRIVKKSEEVLTETGDRRQTFVVS